LVVDGGRDWDVDGARVALVGLGSTALLTGGNWKTPASLTEERASWVAARNKNAREIFLEAEMIQ